MKYNIYLKNEKGITCYGELAKKGPRSRERKSLTLKEKTILIVRELNQLLPRIAIKQKTMYYFWKEE